MRRLANVVGAMVGVRVAGVHPEVRVPVPAHAGEEIEHGNLERLGVAPHQIVNLGEGGSESRAGT